MTIDTDPKKIEALLTRGVENIFPSREFLSARLKEGKQLSLYLGIDPTGPDLHIGHSIQLRKLRQFQELGHKIILLIGDFTGMIGDPTDKSATRVRLTREQVLKNAEKYKEQAGKILDFGGKNSVELKYNSEWLGKMSFTEVVELAAHFTVPQMLARDMFKQRIKDGKDIYMHEFLYPLMQGYDCVAMDVDGEVGGNDQTFNMLAGRTLMKAMKGKEKFVIANKLLEDPTGKKMGKSEGNMIRLSDSSDEVFGKIMSWTDGMILPGFEILTDVELKPIEKEIKSGVNPRDLKARLAREIVAQYFGEKEAQAASDQFDQMFKEHEIPENIPEHKIASAMLIVDVLVDSGIAKSKSDARRLIEGGGVKLDEKVVEDLEQVVKPTKEGVLIQKGKRHFVRIIK
ncbi:tyrosine--tRNA ligase [Candidatus Uhrbacteria bacterium]|nr:tyrosine--tRNA ligase [Candidatus Uhrbacteria bacterium]